MSSRTLLLVVLFFCLFTSSQRTKRTRRSNSTAANANCQFNSNRFRLCKQHLGRATHRRQRSTADQFSGTNRKSTFLT